MEYKTDKRTKNLTLRDIRIGDWVQCWNKITERYTPPEKITAIFEDGTVNTIIDDEQGDPFEYDISEVDALPITEELLKGFGIETKKNDLGNYELYHNGKKILFCYIDKNMSGETFLLDPDLNHCYFFHELIDSIPDNIKLEWKGIKE